MTMIKLSPHGGWLLLVDLDVSVKLMWTLHLLSQPSIVQILWLLYLILWNWCEKICGR